MSAGGGPHVCEYTYYYSESLSMRFMVFSLQKNVAAMVNSVGKPIGFLFTKTFLCANVIYTGR